MEKKIKLKKQIVYSHFVSSLFCDSSLSVFSPPCFVVSAFSTTGVNCVGSTGGTAVPLSFSPFLSNSHFSSSCVTSWPKNELLFLHKMDPDPHFENLICFSQKMDPDPIFIKLIKQTVCAHSVSSLLSILFFLSFLLALTWLLFSSSLLSCLFLFF